MIDPMGRHQVLFFVTLQCLILMILSFGTTLIFSEDNFMSQIVFNQDVLWIGFGGVVLLLSFSTLATYLLPGLRRCQAFIDQTLFSEIKRSDALYFGLLTGVSEELFFRGVLQTHWGILVASVIFGLVHLPGLAYWQYAVWATVTGFYLGGIYLWTENLLVVIMIHAINNTLVVLLWPYLRKRLRFSEYQNDET